MAINLGGGGAWRVKFASTSNFISPGQTGDLVTIAAPAGQFVKLTFLTTSGSAEQNGISISSDGVLVISEKILSDITPATGVYRFFISKHYQNASPGLTFSANAISSVIGKSITINKNTGNTAQGITYSYEYGVL